MATLARAQAIGIAILLMAASAGAVEDDAAGRAEAAARRAEAAATRSEDAARRVEDAASRLERLVERLEAQETRRGHGDGR